MLGLIRALQAVLPEQARDYVYAGASVQDITDTWTSLALRRIGGIAWRNNRSRKRLLELAVEHRATVMPGRTHGQPGSPVTFGWKAASWAVGRRHLDRMREGAPRWLVGQLGGGVGSLVFYGELGPRSGPGSAPSSGLATRASRGSRPVTEAPSSPSSSR